MCLLFCYWYTAADTYHCCYYFNKISFVPPRSPVRHSRRNQTRNSTVVIHSSGTRTGRGFVLCWFVCLMFCGGHYLLQQLLLLLSLLFAAIFCCCHASSVLLYTKRFVCVVVGHKIFVPTHHRIHRYTSYACTHTHTHNCDTHVHTHIQSR